MTETKQCKVPGIRSIELRAEVITTYTQRSHLTNNETASISRAFLKADTGNDIVFINIYVHKPVFEVAVWVVIDRSESKNGIMWRLQWATAILGALTRIMRALATEKVHKWPWSMKKYSLYHDKPGRRRPRNRLVVRVDFFPCQSDCDLHTEACISTFFLVPRQGIFVEVYTVFEFYKYKCQPYYTEMQFHYLLFMLRDQMRWSSSAATH